MKNSKGKGKWVTRLKRETEKKVYFYLALVMSLVWFLSEFAET